MQQVFLANGEIIFSELTVYAVGTGHRITKNMQKFQPAIKHITVYVNEENKKFMRLGNGGSLHEIVFEESDPEGRKTCIKTAKFTYIIKSYTKDKKLY